MKKPRYKWKPLQKAVVLPPTEQLIREHMAHMGKTREEVLAFFAAEEKQIELWRNDIYQVEVKRHDEIVHLNIRRVDGGPILRDWRHFQQIKNELIGPECEAIELYPAESRLADAANKYHLYGIADPTFRFPFGSMERYVSYETGKTPGTRQRPL